MLRFWFFVFFAGGAMGAGGALADAHSPLEAAFSGAGTASLENDYSFFSNPALLAFQTRPGALAAYRLDSGDQSGLIAAQDFSGALPAGIFLSKTWKKGRESEKTKLKWGLAVAQKAGRSLSFGGAFQKADVFRVRLGLGWRAGARTAFGLAFGSLPLPFGKSESETKERVLSVGAYQGFSKNFSGRADADFDLKSRGWTLKGGGEGRLFKFLALRGGGRCDLKRSRCSQSFGGGLAGGRLQIDYGAEGLFRRRVRWPRFLNGNGRQGVRGRKGAGETSHVLSARLIF